MAAMSPEHKDALARGRRQAQAVRAYLEALRDEGGSRHPARARLERRVAELRRAIDRAEHAAERVELLREWLQLERRRAQLEAGPDLDTLEAAFVEVVAPFSERKGITYPAWREVGVPARVLRAAGMRRRRRPRV